MMTSSTTIQKIRQFGKVYCCVWSISIICCLVCELMQTLAEIKLNRYCKKTPSYLVVQTKLASKSEKPMYTQNPNLESCIEKKCGLSPPLLHSIIVDHWHLQCFGVFIETIKVWFTMVGKNVPWNILEVVKLTIGLTFEKLPLVIPQGCHSKCDLNLSLLIPFIWKQPISTKLNQFDLSKTIESNIIRPNSCCNPIEIKINTIQIHSIQNCAKVVLVQNLTMNANYNINVMWDL
jgi:hypothetical protein